MSSPSHTLEDERLDVQTFDLFGYCFAFHTNEPWAAERFQTLYSGRRAKPGAESLDLYELRLERPAVGGAEWLIRLPESTVRRAQTLENGLRIVEETICAAVVRDKNGLHGIHGAVIYGPRGDVLISGVSGAGKSTLSLALAARGMRAGGDDAALLDPSTDLVEPIPRCFHLDERSLAMLSNVGLDLPLDPPRREFLTPADFGVVAPSPARIRFIFLLDPERADSPIPTPQSQAEMAAALLMETGRGYFSDADGVRALTRLVGGARCYRLRSGCLAATADLVAKLAGVPG